MIMLRAFHFRFWSRIAFHSIFFFALGAAMILCGCAGRGELVRAYTNPVDVSIADPQILHDGDLYYAYGTSIGDRGFEVFSSPDLVHWRRRGVCFEKSPTSWGQDNFWAPEVIRSGDTVYLFYTAYNKSANVRNICVATAASPLGPFADAVTPLLPVERGFIDGHPYIDPATGDAYIFALEENLRPPQIVAARLAPDLLSLAEPLQPMLTATEPWEHGWVEAPFLLLHKGTYYMMFSGFGFQSLDYAIGYATAPSPLGPWTKHSGNPILIRAGAAMGTGHNAAILSPDGHELFTAYHRHLSKAGGGPREMAIDRLRFVEQPGGGLDLLVCDGPTDSPQPLPSGARPMTMGRSDEFDGADLDWRRWMSIGEDQDRWRLDGGALVIETKNGDIWSDRLDASGIFLQYAPPGDWAIETQVAFTPEANYEQAFLLVWQDQSHYIKMGTVWSDGEPRIETAMEVGGLYQGRSEINAWGGNLCLRIEKRGTGYRFFVRGADEGEGGEWSEIGPGWTAPFDARKIGLGAFSPQSGAARTARFEYIKIIPSK